MYDNIKNTQSLKCLSNKNQIYIYFYFSLNNKIILFTLNFTSEIIISNVLPK